MTETKFYQFLNAKREWIYELARQNGTHLPDGRLALSRRELEEWEWYEDEETEMTEEDYKNW
jgi:hypothetical protein